MELPQLDLLRSMGSYKGIVMLSLLLGLAPSASGQLDETDVSGLSREMRLGIRYYEKGDDIKAMDRFMEVLTLGDPAERSMANDYINRITRRMNTGKEGEGA